LTQSRSNKKKGCGRGCGIVALVFLGLGALLAAFLGLTVGKTKRVEQSLNERYGEAPDFVPTMDGSIPPERVEAFLRVRERVLEHCPGFQERFGVVVRFDRLEQDESVPGEEVARESVGVLKAMLGYGPAFLRFMDARNHALLDERMGLGEYMYVYVLAYRQQLVQVRDSPYVDVEQAYVGNRARNELTRILQNQLHSLESGPTWSAEADLVAELRDEIADLEAGRVGLPWEDGLPPAIAASLEPYAEPLARTYCLGIAKMELMQKNKGLNIKN
jgi:hypothetical protein